MATKKITPVNPDTKVSDEAEEQDTAEAERKTASFKAFRKSARKTSSFRGA